MQYMGRVEEGEDGETYFSWDLFFVVLGLKDNGKSATEADLSPPRKMEGCERLGSYTL